MLISGAGAFGPRIESRPARVTFLSGLDNGLALFSHFVIFRQDQPLCARSLGPPAALIGSFQRTFAKAPNGGFPECRPLWTGPVLIQVLPVWPVVASRDYPLWVRPRLPTLPVGAAIRPPDSQGSSTVNPALGL